MIRLGPAGTPTTANTTAEGLAQTAELGLQAFEVEFVRGVHMSLPTAETLGKQAADLGLKLSVHAPYFINLNSLKPEVIEASRVRISKSLEVANALQAELIVVHAGFYSGKTSQEATANILAQVKLCSELAEKKEWTPKIGLELMGKVASWGTLDEIATVCKQVPRAVPVLDLAHYHARYQGKLKTEKDFEDLLVKYETIKTDSLHAHFSGINYSEKGERNHLPLSAKEPDYQLAVKPLKKRKYDITLICESPLLEQDALLMQKYLL